ncbi:MAG: hypothetical protein ACRCVE_13595, partial [Plesiomonas sp.]
DGFQLTLQVCLKVLFGAAVGGNLDNSTQMKFRVVVEKEDKVRNVQLLTHHQTDVIPVIYGQQGKDEVCLRSLRILHCHLEME